MKKLLIPLLLILMLTSCGSSDVQKKRPDFSVNASVEFKYMDSEYSADVRTSSDGTVTMTVTSPEDISGIVFVCSADEITARCGNVKIPCENGYIPFTQLYKILSFAESSVPAAIEAEDEINVFEYYSNGDRYVISADAETDRIIRIETPVCIYSLTVD